MICTGSVKMSLRMPILILGQLIMIYVIENYGLVLGVITGIIITFGGGFILFERWWSGEWPFTRKRRYLGKMEKKIGKAGKAYSLTRKGILYHDILKEAVEKIQKRCLNCGDYTSDERTISGDPLPKGAYPSSGVCQRDGWSCGKWVSIKGEQNRLNEYDIFKIFGNKNRIHIIRKITAQDGKATHSDLSHRLGLNPKITRDNLVILKNTGIIEKLKIGYGFTDFGEHLGALLEKTCTTFEVFVDNENDLKKGRCTE